MNNWTGILKSKKSILSFCVYLYILEGLKLKKYSVYKGWNEYIIENFNK